MPTYSETVLQIARGWFEASHNELFVDVYVPCSGAGGTEFLVPGIEVLREMMTGAQANTVFTILRNNPYPFRMTYNEDLSRFLKARMAPGEEWSVCDRAVFPEPFEPFASSDSPEGLIAELSSADCTEFYGEEVYVGMGVKSYPRYGIPNDNPDLLLVLKPGPITERYINPKQGQFT